MPPAAIHCNLLPTERLWLREINPQVYRALFTAGTPDEIMQVLGLSSAYELEMERQRYQQGMTTFNLSFKNFQLIEKKSGRIIGTCGFHTWMLYHHRAEIGYELFEEKWRRKGLMSEALRCIIAFGFEQMNLHRIEALIEPRNEPSLKLVKKLGFREEGLLKQHYLKDKVFEDSLMFALLKEEYEQCKNQWAG